MIEAPSRTSFDVARAQLDRVAELLGLEPGTRQLLRSPQREIHVTIPVRMDDGQVQVFEGFRIQHNDARGPAKGGVRFHPLETVDTVRALAMWTTWKAAVVDIPLGGAMGGVVCDPHTLSLREVESICRGWVRKLARNIGPLIDIPEPDIMTGAQHMTWMMDEYETIMQAHYPGVITGKPVTAGGSRGRAQATGYGLVYMLREALKELDLRPDRTRASVQGFGNVARHAIELYQQIGGRVVCVATWDQADATSYAFVRKDGIDLAELGGIADSFGGIDRRRAEALGYEVLPGAAWLEQDAEILIPAALEAQITEENVGSIGRQVRVVAEGANGPTTPEAEAALLERGVFIIPDLIANAGGMVCSYFEQVQSNMNYTWELAEVLGKLDMRLTTAFLEIVELAGSKGLSMRDAALLLAINRVATVCHQRGWV